MKTLLNFASKALLWSALGAVPAVSAATRTFDFEPPIYDNSNVPSNGHNPVATQDGWVINDPGQGWDSSYPSGYLSFLADWDSQIAPRSTAGALGGVFDSPFKRSIDLSHPLGADPIANNSGGSSFKANFAILENVDPNYPGKDTFGWKFFDDNNDIVLSIDFVPSTTPGTLEVFWSDDGNLNNSVSGSWLLYYDRSYTLDLSFSNPTAGADLGFSFNILGASDVILPGEPNTTTDPITGALLGDGTASWGGFAATWNVTALDPSEAGSNFMVFDNLRVDSVPEPGVACLMALSVAGLALRRRVLL